MEQLPIEEELSFVIPRETPWGLYIWGTLAGLALLVILIVVVRKVILRARYIADQRRPEREALSELADVFRRWREAGYILFCYQITRIIKVYAQRRFAVPVEYYTTTEITRLVDEGGLDEQVPGPRLLDLLNDCDQLKFSGVSTEADEVERIFSEARDFVKQTAWRG